MKMSVEKCNKEVLKSFVEYCKKYPELRFWQALRNWSEYEFIMVSDSDEILASPYAQDTFYFTGKNKKEQR